MGSGLHKLYEAAHIQSSVVRITVGSLVLGPVFSSIIVLYPDVDSILIAWHCLLAPGRYSLAFRWRRL